MLTWYETVSELYGIRVDSKKARIWAELIDDGVTNFNADELIDVLKWVRNKRETDKFKRVPTVENIIIWIKWYRKEQMAERRGYNRDSAEGMADAVWQDMLRAVDTEARWNILVEGGAPLPADENGRYQYRQEWTNNHRQELENRARRRWPAWDKELNVIRARFGRVMSAVAAGIAREVGE